MLSHFLSGAFSYLRDPDFSGYVRQFSYLGVFVWFTFFDLVVPFPDEISLLTLGYLAAAGIMNPFVAGIVAIASFLAADALSFSLARGGSSFIARRLKRPKAHSIRGYIARNLERHLPGTLIGICFVPKMRLWGPLVAGSSRISFGRFLAFDAIGVTLFVCVYETLGYFFGASFSAVFAGLAQYQTPIFVALLFIFGLILLVVHSMAMKEEHAA